MAWQYQIIRKDINGTDIYSVHEVYINEVGEVCRVSVDPIELIGESVVDLMEKLAEIKGYMYINGVVGEEIFDIMETQEPSMIQKEVEYDMVEEIPDLIDMFEGGG